MADTRSNKVNINTASPEELDQIPNIGRDCVERIVQERKKRGGFKSIEELDSIGGFGKEAIENLRRHATV